MASFRFRFIMLDVCLKTLIVNQMKLNPIVLIT